MPTAADKVLESLAMPESAAEALTRAVGDELVRQIVGDHYKRAPPPRHRAVRARGEVCSKNVAVGATGASKPRAAQVYCLTPPPLPRAEGHRFKIDLACLPTFVRCEP
jgi:hypothetical protein